MNKKYSFTRLALCVLCGASIIVLPGLASAGWVAQTSGTTYGLFSVHFPVDAQTGYAVGVGGTILKTVETGSGRASPAGSTSSDPRVGTASP